MSRLTELLEAARKRQGHYYLAGVIKAYCDNGRCTAREFRIMIKTYSAKDPVEVYCPLCGKKPIVNSVQTLFEYEHDRDEDARVRVNVQRYQKRTGDIFIPASLFLDDSLPE